MYEKVGRKDENVALVSIAHNVVFTLIRLRPKRYGRCIDVETTLCVYRVPVIFKLYAEQGYAALQRLENINQIIFINIINIL